MKLTIDFSAAAVEDREPTSTASRRGVVSRVRKGDLDRVTAYLPYELGAELRLRCAGKRIELSEAVAEALRAWLATPDGS